MKYLAIAAALAFASSPVMGQSVDDTNSYSYLMRQKYPVIQGDVTDRPYRTIGHISKHIRKFTIFSKGADFQKIQKELWEKARKQGSVDAVIKVMWGEEVPSWTAAAVDARGIMIKFLSDDEIAEWKARQGPPQSSEAPPPSQ